MKKINLIIILFLILLMVFAEYIAQSNRDQVEKLTPFPLENEQNKNAGSSFLETILFHKNRPKTTHPKVTISGADSDQSECSMVRKVTEIVKTNFAGYVLEYPCTAGSKGSIRTEKSEDNKTIKEEYTLYLGIQLGSEKKSIWNDRLSNDREGKQSFLIILKSNGKIRQSPLFENLRNYTLAKTNKFAGLDVYYKTSNPRSVVALLKNFIDASGNHPSINCYLDANDKIEDLFSDLYNLDYKYASCSAHWMLTEDISLLVHSFKAEYAYHFNNLYPTINSGLQQIIIKKLVTPSIEKQE